MSHGHSLRAGEVEWVVKVEGDKEIALETSLGNGPLLGNLKPSTSALEDAEVVAAAKLIH